VIASRSPRPFGVNANIARHFIDAARPRWRCRESTSREVKHCEEFVKELQSKSSYKVVDEVGPDVLRVKVKIVNLYVNAPDTGTAGISRHYTISAGEMTLLAELYDSETGEVLARVIDRSEGRRTAGLSFTDSVTNIDQARFTAAGWARILRGALDKAHGIGKR
jgi:hypothetical protein